MNVVASAEPADDLQLDSFVHTSRLICHLELAHEPAHQGNFHHRQGLPQVAIIKPSNHQITKSQINSRIRQSACILNHFWHLFPPLHWFNLIIILYPQFFYSQIPLISLYSICIHSTSPFLTFTIINRLFMMDVFMCSFGKIFLIRVWINSFSMLKQDFWSISAEEGQVTFQYLFTLHSLDFLVQLCSSRFFFLNFRNHLGFFHMNFMEFW